MNQKIADISYLLNYFEGKYDQWILTSNKQKKEIIESHVSQFIEHNMDGALYIEINDGRASGLCDFPHFGEDLKKIIRVLKEKSK